MNMGVLLGSMAVLAMGSVSGQTATGIHLADVRFRGETRLVGVDLRKCAADLKSRTYEGTEWLAGVTESVRGVCLQRNGYYKAAVQASSEQLADKHETHQFAVTFDIGAGPRYRLGEFEFKGNHVFPAEVLRSMFKVVSGDVFNPAKIAEGLDHMRTAYMQSGYLNFTSVPDTRFDESRRLINVLIYCDEAR